MNDLFDLPFEEEPGPQDQAESELQDRAQVRTEFSPGGEPSRGVDQRR